MLGILPIDADSTENECFYDCYPVHQKKAQSGVILKKRDGTQRGHRNDPRCSHFAVLLSPHSTIPCSHSAKKNMKFPESPLCQ